MTKPSDTLVWLDLEMTGLDPDQHDIVEMAVVLTYPNLEEVAPPLALAIWQPDAALALMSPFVRAMHEKTGLIAQIKQSQTSLLEAERAALELVSKHASYRTARLCGNSIGQDRRFLVRHMPALENYLHYRQVDVSTIKELSGWWYGSKYEKPEEGKHSALNDVRQSIAELKFYRQNVFR
jgi:oligoribonuclease